MGPLHAEPNGSTTEGSDAVELLASSSSQPLHAEPNSSATESTAAVELLASSAIRRASDLAAFLQYYQPLARSQVRSCYVEDQWHTQLPAAWRPHLDALSLVDLARLLESPTPPPSVTGLWPLSLLAFIATAHALRLPGQMSPRGSARGSGTTTTPRKGKRAGGAVTDQGRCTEEDQVSRALRLAMKPKKIHEIVHMSALADAVGHLAGCARIVDVGSGLGYLSRTLAFDYAWNVVAVEGESSYVEEAHRIDSQVGKNLRQLVPSGASLKHVAARLAPECTPDDFLKVVADARPSGQTTNSSIAGDAEGQGQVNPAHASGASTLVGLHTCGDLGPTMLRVFHHAGDAVNALVNVGCCYMKMSEAGCRAWTGAGWDKSTDEGRRSTAKDADAASGAAAHSYGFPMSAHVQSLGVVAGFPLREHACHSLIAYKERLRLAASPPTPGDETTREAEASLRLHGRRAILDLLLTRMRPNEPIPALGSIKGAARMGLEAYLTAGWAQSGRQPLPDDVWRAFLAEAEALDARWRRVVVLYVLRLLLAPLWEALVLLDRLLYLREDLGHFAALVPLFDPSLSPRSYALVAVKRGIELGGGQASHPRFPGTTSDDRAESSASAKALMRCWSCVEDSLEPGAALSRWRRDLVT